MPGIPSAFKRAPEMSPTPVSRTPFLSTACSCQVFPNLEPKKLSKEGPTFSVQVTYSLWTSPHLTNSSRACSLGASY